MSSKFCQMRPLVTLATDRVTVGKTVSSHFLEGFLLDSSLTKITYTDLYTTYKNLQDSDTSRIRDI